VAVRALPFLMALYFVDFLDRANSDISEDLQLTSTMFGLASGIFYIGYVLVEVPSNLALERFGARRWLVRIAVSWGIVGVAIGFAPNAATLLTLRFLPGVAEAGLFSGVIFYLTRWFPGAYRARIVAMFMMASPIAAAVGTPVSAWLISLGEGKFGAIPSFWALPAQFLTGAAAAGGIALINSIGNLGGGRGLHGDLGGGRGGTAYHPRSRHVGEQVPSVPTHRLIDKVSR